MTSANVTEFLIIKNGKSVGNHRQNWMCKTSWDKLLVYQPLKEHTILPYGYDEEEDLWEGDEENLYDFLLRVSLSDKSIREYFVSEKRDDKIDQVIK